MKIRLTENKLKQIVEESVKNVLLEYSPEFYYHAADVASQKRVNPNMGDEERKKRLNQRVAFNQHATDLYNKQGGGSCITNSASHQINYKSAKGYDAYITADGVVGIVGKQMKYNHTNLPNELRVKPEDAKIIADWCNRFVKNDYALQSLGNPRFWTIK